MFVRCVCLGLLLVVGWPAAAPAQALRDALRQRLAGTGAADESLKKVSWKIGDVERTALVYDPPKKTDGKRPVVFAFHGHGGKSEFGARQFEFHKLWPEAVCIYPQGLPTPVPVIDVDGKFPGWQKYVGDQDDRDLKFFDAMLKTLVEEYAGNEQRVYVAGHSNGGFFAYVLAAARGDKLAAIAPVAGALNLRDFPKQKPLPVFHVAGESDTIVRYELQQRTIEQVKKLNGCATDGKPAGEFCTEYASPTGTPVVTWIHDGGHRIPPGAPQRIVAFFKSQKR